MSGCLPFERIDDILEGSMYARREGRCQVAMEWVFFKLIKDYIETVNTLPLMTLQKMYVFLLDAIGSDENTQTFVGVRFIMFQEII